MLEANMEFKKGILFIRLEGGLIKRTVNYLESEVIPILLSQGVRNVVINLDKLNIIDQEGITSLLELADIASNNKGKATICSLTNPEVKEKIHKSIYINKFYETSNELTALGVMKL